MKLPALPILVLSRSLGLYSLALGAVGLAIPRILSRRLGTPGGPWLVRAFGAREVAAGLAILKDPGAVAGPAARLGGDLLDIGVLLPAAFAGGRHRRAAGIALGAAIGAAVLDLICTSTLVADEQRRAETALRTRWHPPAKLATPGG